MKFEFVLDNFKKREGPFATKMKHRHSQPRGLPASRKENNPSLAGRYSEAFYMMPRKSCTDVLSATAPCVPSHACVFTLLLCAWCRPAARVQR